MKSDLLDFLYEKYSIDILKNEKQHGKISDKLGEVYEAYILKIFDSIESIMYFFNKDKCSMEHYIISQVLSILKIDIKSITDICSINKGLTRTVAGGMPKTDVVILIESREREIRIVAINVKHSSKPKVSIAEYDVETICAQVGIESEEIKSLMMKFQTDKSAKNFTKDEKDRLTLLLRPYKEKLVRWCITLSPDPIKNNEIYPEILIRFVVRNLVCEEVKIQSTEEYVQETLTKKAGFGTGLNWTYATGSAGKKIQFKG